MRRYLLLILIPVIFASCSTTMVFKPGDGECYSLDSPVSDDIYLVINDKREKKEFSEELQSALVACLTNNYNVILLKDVVGQVLPSYYVLDIDEYGAWCEKDYCNATTKITITCYMQNNMMRTVPVNKTVNLVNTFNESTALEALQNSLNEAIRSTVNYIAVVR